MAATRIFLCHNIDKTSQRATQVLDQLRARLQEEGSEVVSYPDSPDNDDFLTFLQQQIPACNWFILVQTPEAIALPQMHQAVATALRLVEQQRLEGIVRLIALPSDSEDAPQEWETIATFDATQDPARAIEKLVLRLSAQGPVGTGAGAGPIPISALVTPHLNNALPSLTYDRPPAPPSGFKKFRQTLKLGYQDLTYKRKGLMVSLLLILLFLVLFASVGVILLHVLPSQAKVPPTPVPQAPIYGHVYFYSTNQAITQATSNIMDEVDIYLQNLKSPAAGNSYYAWMLPDVNNSDGRIIAIGQFTPDNGSAHLTYKSPTQTNVLGEVSRFLVTEESASPQPNNPTADQSKWRYYGIFPQTPDLNDTNHYSALDHLRHLLVSGPVSMTNNPGFLPGGLGVWFLQNVSYLYYWSLTARGEETYDLTAMHNDVVRMLDVLDGASIVNQDVPQKTPLLIGSPYSQKPLLTLDPNTMIPGYIDDIEAHLLGFSGSPGVTSEQQALSGQIDSQLNALKVVLDQIRADAKQLVTMTISDLNSPTAQSTIYDLTNQAANAYFGETNAITGVHQGGVMAFFEQLQQLARFTITTYTGSAS